MDETRIERALRQGPPFRTSYASRPLPLGPEVVGRSRPSGALRLVALMVLTVMILVASIAALTASGVLRRPTIDVSPLTHADYDAATWTEVGSLATGRQATSATLLPDGRVLVVGGSTTLNGDPTSGAELFDPVTRTWSAGAPSIGVHQRHTATLLSDGTVLVAGGVDSPLAEIYDPTTGSWTATGTMAKVRPGHTATRLHDGRVLAAGGLGGAFLGSELYDPATGTWRPAGTMMVDARSGHTATLLPDGRVLVIVGSIVSSEPSMAEVYDPASDAWSPAAPPPREFTGHTATLLPDGTVLLAGGWHDDYGRIEASAVLYDPVKDTWSPVADLLQARGGHTATLLDDATVLVAGGFGDLWQKDCGNILATSERFDPVRRTWSAAQPMASVRYSHEATRLIDGSVLITGGTDTGCMRDPLASVELFGPGTGR
jgi:hypothetical protein